MDQIVARHACQTLFLRYSEASDPFEEFGFDSRRMEQRFRGTDDEGWLQLERAFSSAARSEAFEADDDD
jgi:hypothetical protein